MTAADAPDARWIGVRWEDHDRHPWLAFVAAVGILAAFTMAVFGLPPINMHGPLHYLGIMGPLCGMTRATRHLARFELATALRYNPAVFLLAFGGFVAVGRWAHGWRTGRWLSVRIGRHRLILVAATVIVALTIRQQANVELLR